ncbi:MAG: SIMPL domain-containing protein [Candidatus Gastranaerophilales bacterium]|nr:SIMPL domain-containing protein [Candidatus Gastranaerophilales bacterium]
MKRLFALAILSSMLIPATIAVEPVIQESTISVDASANSDIEPDTLKVKFYVENSGTNLADIKAKNDKIVNSAINEIKKKLNSDESVKTIAFRVNNIYSYKDKIRIFQKYEVVNGFEVKLKELSKTSEIIKLAMDNGVKRVDNLNFYIENTENPCNELMKKATTIAKNRATIVATSAGAAIGRPKTISPYCSLNSNYVSRKLYANAMVKSSMDGMASESEAVESIEPGTISVKAGVNMTYYLK